MAADNPLNNEEEVLLDQGQLAAVLHEAADVHPVELRPEPQVGTTLLLDAGGNHVTITMTDDGALLSKGDFEVLSNLRVERLRHQNAHRDLIGAPVETLRELGLPLFWNREWLERKHADTGSFTRLARTYKREVKGAAGHTISSFARENLGVWVTDREVNLRDRLVCMFDYAGGKATQKEMAESFGVTRSTVSHWISDARKAYQELQEQAEFLADPAALERFARRHRLEPDTIEAWLRDGSRVYSQRSRQRPRTRSPEEYEKLKQQFFSLLDVSGGKINQSRAALKFEVDRSTIRSWLEQFRLQRSR